MRYLKAIAAVLLIVMFGGVAIGQVEPMTWPAHLLTVGTLVAAAMAARLLLKGK